MTVRPDPTHELIARRDDVFGRGSPVFYNPPLHLVRGEGVWLVDADGRRYLDLYNNIPVVGHCNPKVVEALYRQASTHTTHSRYLDENIVAYAERLLALHHPDINRLVFTCTGTEANDVALQMARMATGGRGFICTDATYHGNSGTVSMLTRAPRRGRPDIHAIPFPQRYRPLRPDVTDEELAEAYLAEVQAAIDDFAADDIPLAGIILCPIFANEGLPDVPADFVARACDLVRAAGGLVIIDEVQAGLGRGGTWWGYQQAAVVPDIVTMGKPLGNGLPLAACAARSDIVEVFRARSRYFNTFAATPVHGAVGLAVLDEIERHSLVSRAGALGTRLLEQLRALTVSTPQVGDVRGRGLFIAIEWIHPDRGNEPDWLGAVDMTVRLKDRGVLVANAGAHGNILKIRPPLVLQPDHAEHFLEIFGRVLESLHG